MKRTAVALVVVAVVLGGCGGDPTTITGSTSEQASGSESASGAGSQPSGSESANPGGSSGNGSATAGSGSGSGSNGGGSGPASATSAPGQHGAGATAVVLSLPADHYAGFVTADGNLGCMFSNVQVACGASQADWAAPPPNDPTCDLDAISVLTLQAGKAGWVTECRGDPPAWVFAGDEYSDDWFVVGRDRRVTVRDQQRAVLGSGSTMQQGSMLCSVADTEVTCADQNTKHGFTISRAGHTIF